MYGIKLIWLYSHGTKQDEITTTKLHVLPWLHKPSNKDQLPNIFIYKYM